MIQAANSSTVYCWETYSTGVSITTSYGLVYLDSSFCYNSDFYSTIGS